jgi:DNA (cytosine-5)-methyltransferase 1
MSKLKMIDLFCGIGGFHEAAKKTKKIETVYASDMDKYPSEVYLLNNNINAHKDITTQNEKTDIPNHDILTAGFPCQSFSVAGKRLGFQDDTRGTLFFDIVRIAKEHKPKVLFLENVKGLVNHDNGNTFKTILNTLDEINYDVFYKTLNTYKFGNIPQNRERIYIIAFRKDLKVKNFKFPSEKKLTNDFLNFIDRSIKQEDKYYYGKRFKIWNKIKDEVTSMDTAYQWRRKYVRSNQKNICPTLTANMGTGGHNVPLILDNFGIRKLTPKECLKLQGFNSNFKIPIKMSDSRIYKQAGNSVSVPVIHSIFKEILKALSH